MSEKEKLRSILRLARLHGAKSVEFREDGVVVHDPSGKEVVPTIAGQRTTMAPEQILEISRSSWGRSSADLDLDGIGWNIKVDGAVAVLKPKKPFPPTLGSIAPFDAEQLAALRSLYGSNDLYISFQVEGETRLKDAAMAMVAERASIGLPTTTNVHYASTYSSTELPKLEFDDIDDAAAWTVMQHDPRTSPRNGQVAEQPTVFMSGTTGYQRHLRDPFHEDYDDKGLAQVLVAICVEDSKPAGGIFFSRTAKTLLAPEQAKAPELPWNMIEANAERRRAAAPKRQKTWLETTAKVAKAFVEAKIPRGYVSGHSLYFHGPVAFCESDHNPIAAFVDDVAGKRTIVFGRSPSWEGSAVASMSSSDIVRSLREAGAISSEYAHHMDAAAEPGEMEVVRLGDLRSAIRFADLEATRIPSRFMRSKDEDEHPRTAVIDQAGLDAWFAGELARARRTMEEAHATKAAFPTKKKANSISAIVRLHDLGQRLNALYGLKCDAIEGIEELRDRADAEWAGVQSREAMLKDRKESQTPPVASGL